MIKVFVFAGTSADAIAQGEADLNLLRAAGWSVVGFSSLIVILQK